MLMSNEELDEMFNKLNNTKEQMKELLKNDNLYNKLLENYHPNIVIRDLIDIKIEYQIYLIANTKELDLFADKVLNRILYLVNLDSNKYNEKELIEQFKENFETYYNDLKDKDSDIDFIKQFNKSFF